MQATSLDDLLTFGAAGLSAHHDCVYMRKLGPPAFIFRYLCRASFTMSGFCEDDRKVTLYPKGIFGESRDEKQPFIRCLQWADKIQDSEKDIDFRSAKELIDTTTPDRLRVVFLSNCSQSTSGSDLEEFMKLYKHFSVPSEVLTERMRSVNHSFGASTAVGSDAEIAWCHFLCRQVEGSDRMAFTYLRNDQGGQSQSSVALSLWITCDFFLHVANDKAVTLLCFGAPKGVVQRFEGLRENKFWDNALQEPYLLFTIIFDELHDLFDGLSKVLALSIRNVEGAAISQTRVPKQWTKMHGAQKYTLPAPGYIDEETNNYFAGIAHL